MAIGAIACGAIFMVLSPQPKIKRTTSPPPRPLAYEQRLATPQPEAAPGESAPPQKEISPVEPLPVEAAPVETAPGETAPAASVETAAPEPDAQDAAAAEESAPDAGAPTADNPASSDATPLPPAEDADGSDPMAGAPQDRPGPPDQMAAWPREGADPSQPVAPGEGADASDPNAPPGEPGAGADEWVQVLVSGAGMYATASDDAPMLFAFPYGRGLKVVSRYQDWVEVTDPQSAATGWMKSSYLAPVAAAPGPPGEVDAGYQDEQPRGWFRRRPGGLADVISRALGGL